MFSSTFTMFHERLILYCVSFIILLIKTGSSENSICRSQESCAACIRNPGCVWCTKPFNDSTQPFIRCMDDSSISSYNCPENYIEKIEQKMEEISNHPVSDTNHIIQIQPQKIKLSMRVGETKNIPIIYQQANDYPLDLYFLMDFSQSMDDDRNKIISLGSNLSKLKNTLSNNFYIGFGTFVDKPVMPYILSKNVGNVKGCEPIYDFWHHLPLSGDSELFLNRLKTQNISFNFDAPEGGFDALVQVLTCEKIGWREKARRFIIFSTDAYSHIAGDGKMAGIVEPNDEKCHMNENGKYTHDLQFDYPSLAQISRLAEKNNISIAFAVTGNVTNFFESIKQEIKGSSVHEIKEDSYNIFEMIVSEVQKSTDSVTLVDNSTGSINLEYTVKCPGSKNMEKGNSCNKLVGRPKIEFETSITVLECPADESQWTQIIEIRPGALNESLIVELNIQCTCPCESRGEANSKSCNENGKFQCGICECDEGRSGETCECDSNGGQDVKVRENLCKADELSEECSGQGVCKCGKCECAKRDNANELIEGKFCECDNFSCQRNKNLICSGNGRCECGVCICQSGWSGEACECVETYATCTNHGTDQICSGNGNCACGVCNCTLTEKFRYSGKYCEECPHCTTDRCEELRDCVECQVHKTGVYDSVECKLHCNSFESEIVEKVENTKIDDYAGNGANAWKICRVADSNICTIVFKYMYRKDDLTLIVQAQKEKECSIEIDILAIILGVVGAILLGGIVLIIIWKIVTTIHDNKKYAKFVKETNAANFNYPHPLYVTPMAEYNNIAFGM